MDWIFQIRITAFATAIFLFLAVQLPEIESLRWWLGAWIIGLLSSMLERFGGGPAAALIAPALLLLRSAALGCIASGLLWQRSRDRFTRHAVGASLALGLLLVAVCSRSEARLAFANGGIALATLLMMVGFLSGYRRRGMWMVSLLSLVLSLGIVHQLFAIASAAHWIHAAPFMAVDLLWSYFEPCAGAMTLLYLVFQDIALGNKQMGDHAERFRQLVCSSSQGICEIDPGGRILFANGKAAEILGLPSEQPSGVWIQERLRACDDEYSLRAVSEFVLRPGVPVNTAKGRILRPDRSECYVDWSCSPLLRDGVPVGATVTLHDVTGRETATRLRTDLLDLIVNNKPVETVSEQLSAAVEEQLPGFCCSILICSGEYFQVAASSHLPQALAQQLRDVQCNRIQQTAGQKGSQELNSWDDAFHSIARQYRLAGTWSEPMVSSANELLGTVLLQHPQTNQLEPWQRRILAEAAQLGALAMEHHGAYQRLLHQGYHDALTGLPNRLLLTDRLKQALARASRNHLQIAYLSIDLDHFKDVNDRYGHDAGDLFLRQITARFASQVRSSDTLARMGGDEFALVLPDLENQHDADRVAQSLIASLREPFELENATVMGAASVGMAFYPQDGNDLETLQRNADRAMYRAKSQGRNQVRCYSGDDPEEESNRLEIEMHLHQAVEKGSFSLHYQPKFTCDRTLAGFEALLRFEHPRLGMVPPSRFIPMAEESGLILSIGEWVLQETCRQILEWQEKNLRPVPVAINVSPVQLASGDFAGAVARTLQATGIRPELLELEITEGVLMSGVPGSSRQINELARLGVRLAVDDFGTGYSCLSYLHQLPLHTLKIDRSFVMKMLEPNGTSCIIETILTLAKKLGLETVAEGVENEEQLELLRAAGCSLIQGYLFARPLSAVDASRLLFEETVSNTAISGAFTVPSWVHSVSNIPLRLPRMRSRKPFRNSN